MGIQYYRVYPSSNEQSTTFQTVLMGESTTKPARFACLPPALLPLSPAVRPCRYRLRCLLFEALPLPSTACPACRSMACRLPLSCRLPCRYGSRLPAVRLCRAGFCRALCAVSACLASALKRPKKSPRAWQGVNLPPPRAFAFTDKREPLTQEKSPRMFQAVTQNPLGLITFAA